MENKNRGTEPKRNIPRDLFLHLLAIITLYWSSIVFITLVWQFINRWFPDALNNRYYFGDYSNILIRFSVSTIIIVFPVFIIVSWYLNKIYRREAVVRESKIRKWLLYLTLFIASLVIIGDLIYVVNTFLGGEVTVRFILKALSIILVAGIIFGYYLDDVRRESPTKAAKYFALVTGILVLSAVVYSFVVVGSPGSTRLMQFDQQKVYDLQNIQDRVVSYYQKTGILPNSLSDFNDSISGYNVPTDPQSQASYEYIVVNSSELSFKLCAKFNKETASDSKTSPYYYDYGISQNWEHGAGRVCFERTIDKKMYPLSNQ